MLDILCGRVDPVAFKTAEFIKRNWNWIRTTCQHIMYELRKIKQGFSKLKSDVLYAAGVSKTKFDQKY